MKEKFKRAKVYNKTLDITIRDSETVKQKQNKTFSKFLLRWGKKAMKMTSKPTKNDQVHLVIKNLQPIYYENLYYTALSSFDQLYEVSIQFKNGMAKKNKTYQHKRWEY